MALNEDRDLDQTPASTAPADDAAAPVADASPAAADTAAQAPDAAPDAEAAPAASADDDAQRAAAIAKKEELVAKLQAFVDAHDWRHGAQQLRPTMEAWQALRSWRTDEENRLWEAFQGARHTIYAARTEERGKAAEAKTKLAEEAEKLRDSVDWKATTDRFHELMAEWKKAGSAGREADDSLWERFNGAQHAFFERRNAHYQELESSHSKAKAAKERLIERLKQEPEPAEEWTAAQWKTAGERVHDLMTEWRAAGHAGRADNDRLWEEFNGLRQKFFDARHAHYEQVESGYKSNAAQKQALIDEARRIAQTMDFGPDNTAAMKQLDIDWKKIGYAGPKTNDALWETFHEAKEKFWIQKRAYNEARHEIYQKKSQEAVERRHSQIADLEAQIAHLRNKMETTTSEDYLENMRGWIAEKEERIGDLKAQIADIERKLR